MFNTFDLHSKSDGKPWNDFKQRTIRSDLRVEKITLAMLGKWTREARYAVKSARRCCPSPSERWYSLD